MEKNKSLDREYVNPGNWEKKKMTTGNNSKDIDLLRRGPCMSPGYFLNQGILKADCPRGRANHIPTVPLAAWGMLLKVYRKQEKGGWR